jgi:hypothetical protein
MTTQTGTGQPTPSVYAAVRAIGTIRPKFQISSDGRVFADTLDVRGTAFWVRGANVLVTCAHVVQDLVVTPIELAGLLVVGSPRGYLRASVLAVDFVHDLASLRLPDDTKPEIIQVESQFGLDLADAYPAVGERVSYAGYPGGLQLLDKSQMPTFATGVVGAQVRQRETAKYIQITGHILGGFSGSPIVADSSPDKVIGVVSKSPSSEVGQAGIFLASSWEHLKALVELACS